MSDIGWRYERVYPGKILALEPFAVTGKVVERAGQWWVEVWVVRRKSLAFWRNLL